MEIWKIFEYIIRAKIIFFNRILNICIVTGICISRPPTLCLAPGPGSGHRLWPPICIYRLWPPICIYRPWPPICICHPWLPICIYRPWPRILLPARGLSLHRATFSPQFVFVFTALAHDLYYRFGTWICIYLIIGGSTSGSSNSSSSNFFGINNTNICMPSLAN